MFVQFSLMANTITVIQSETKPKVLHGVKKQCVCVEELGCIVRAVLYVCLLLVVAEQRLRFCAAAAGDGF